MPVISSGATAVAAPVIAVNRALAASPVYGLGSYVWLDLDGDGVQGDAELGVNGVAVRLLDAGGDPVTDSHGDALTALTATGPGGTMGFSLFDKLTPGDYVVEFAGLPGGYAPATPDSGGDDSDDSDVDPGTLRTGVIEIGPGAADMSPMDSATDGDIDAVAVNRTVALGLAGPCLALGNYVWVDTDGDGRQGDGESGMNGVAAMLWDVDGNPVLDAGGDPYLVTTGSGPGGDPGFYQFGCLPAGGYVVVLDVPSGMALTRADAAGVPEGQNSDFESSGDSFGDSGPIVLDSAESSVRQVDPRVDGSPAAGLVDRTVDAGLILLDSDGPAFPPATGPPSHNGEGTESGSGTDFDADANGGTDSGANGGASGRPGPVRIAATGDDSSSLVRNGLLFLVAGTGMVAISLAALGTQLRRRRP